MKQDNMSETPQDDIATFSAKYGAKDWMGFLNAKKVRYTDLRFGMEYVADPAFLPVLKDALSLAKDDDLYENEGGTNALMWAALGGMVGAKLNMLKQLHSKWVTNNICKTDTNGATPLHYLAYSYDDDPENINLLIKWGVSLNARTKDEGRSALHEHAIYNYNDCNAMRIVALLSHHPDIFNDFEGNTPAYYESKHGWVDRSTDIAYYQGRWHAQKNRSE
ncbi:MAG: hypothetical protein LBG97_06060 [Coriobacteriales bacterium]|jgi:ankyrin repeat protein|nr:hypothetical protein [Coriobacteriales bacterium]